ncbi:hypothetical protein ACRRTK_021667 [Alexandromys fortis]
MAGVAVAVLLLLVFVVLVVLYLRNARGRVQKVENECHNIYEEFPGQKEETTDVNQQSLFTEDTEAICYASLIHLNHASPQDSVSSSSQPYQKPSPDPLLLLLKPSLLGNSGDPARKKTKMWAVPFIGLSSEAFPPTAEPGSFFAITGHMSRREYRKLLCRLEDHHSPADDVYCTIYATPPAKILGQKMPSVLSLRLHIDSDCLPL